MRLFGLGVKNGMDKSAEELSIKNSNKTTNIKILEGEKNEQISAVKKLAIDFILQTYTSQKFTRIEDMKLLIAKGVDPPPKREHSGEIISFIMNLAGISNPAKYAPIFIAWIDFCLKKCIQDNKYI